MFAGEEERGEHKCGKLHDAPEKVARLRKMEAKVCLGGEEIPRYEIP